MGDIVITRQLPPGSLDELVAGGHRLIQRADDEPLAPSELRQAVANADAAVCVLTDRIDADAIDAARAVGRLKVIANVAVGYDNIDVAAATAAGIVVCNTPGVLDETTADLAFALMLAASRGLSSAESVLRAGQWRGWNINDFLGHDIYGSTLGIVGWGRIGQAVARRASGFGMTVLHHSRRPTGVPGETDLEDLLRRSDVVSLHVPSTIDTRHLIDGARLRLMKPTAVLVNTSRGSVVDEEALGEALDDSVIFAAGIDVFDREPDVHPRLLAAPRAVLLPHIGSATVATRRRMAGMAASAVSEALAGNVPDNAVNPASFVTR